MSDEHFINDNLIDFRLKSLILPGTNHHDKHNPESSNQCHACSTIFYVKLSELANHTDIKMFLNMTDKWIKSLVIFNSKMLFIPINDSLHWSLMVVVNADLINEVSSISSL